MEIWLGISTLYLGNLRVSTRRRNTDRSLHFHTFTCPRGVRPPSSATDSNMTPLHLT
jgi:hypothetical protein